MRPRLRATLTATATAVAVATVGIGAALAAPTPMIAAYTLPSSGYKYVYNANLIPSSEYPTIAQENTWNSYLAANNDRVRFWHTGTSCAGKKPCFYIGSTSACAPGGGWGGYAELVYSGSVLIRANKIVFYNCGNEWQNLTSQQRSLAIGHELGHTLGLGHHPGTTGDMMQGAPMGTQWWPSASNMQALNAVYR